MKDKSIGTLRISNGKVFMKKHFGYISLILALYLSALSLKAEDITTRLVSQYVYKYEALEKFNQENDSIGRPDLNQYIIELNPNWIEESPQKNYTQNYYEELSKKLTEFNARREDKLKVYVMVVNNFYGQLKKTIKLDDIKKENIKFRDYVDVSHSDYKKFLSDISALPKGISEAMAKKGYKNRIIYFCGIIQLYSTAEKTKAYLYTSLTAEGPKLKGRRYDLAERMNLNWEVADEETIPETLELISDKIYKGVHNLLAAIEMVIDKGITGKDRDPRCEMSSLEGVAEFNKTIKEISYNGKVTTCATLITSPKDNQKLRSRYVIVENPGDFKKKTFFHEELPDKVQLISEKGYSKHKLYVVYKEIDFAMLPSEWAKFAEDVYSRSSLSGNDILITVPYYKTSCTFLNGYGGETTQKDKLLMPGAYCASSPDIAAQINAAFPSLALETRKTYVEKRWKEVFYQVFSKIPKYLELYFFSIMWNGDVVFHEKKTQGPVTGLTDVVSIYLKIDARYDKYEKALGNRAICMPKLEDILLLNWSVCTDKFDQEVRTIFNSPEDYRVFDQKTNLMQGKLNESLAKSYVEWISAKKVEGVFSAFNAPGGGYFYGGINPVKVQDILTMIDAASFAASFIQLDFIFDAAGAYYAFSNEMYAEGALYTASLALPVSAGTIKAIEKGEKYLLKSAAKGQLVEVPAQIAKAIVRGEKVANQVGDVTKAIVNNPKALERVLHHKENTTFIQSLEGDLLKADESTIKTLNNNPELVDEFQVFHAEGKGDLNKFMEVKSLSPTDPIIHVEFDDIPGINLASLGNDAAVLNAISRIKPEPGYFDVIIHGTPDRFWVLHNGKWEGITHRSLITYLEKNPKFNEAVAVRLISCEAGTKELAQNFANKSKKKVRAISGAKVGVNKSGEVVSTSGNTGHWAEFDKGNWSISFESPGNIPANNRIKAASEGDDVVPLSFFDDVVVKELKATPGANGSISVSLDDGTHLGSGSLDSDRYLTLEVDVKKGPNGEKLASGREVFKKIYSELEKAHPQKPIKGIIGVWGDPVKYKDNLDSFNELIRQGKSKEEAALGTWTGKMAQEKEFNLAFVAGKPSSDGTYKTLTVTFTNDIKVIRQMKLENAIAEFNLAKISNPDVVKESIDEAVTMGMNKELEEIFFAAKRSPDEIVGASGRDHGASFHNQIRDRDPTIPAYKDVKYFDENERLQFEVTVKDGKWYTNGQQLKDGQKYIFIMGKDGKIYAGITKVGEIHHSSFLAGERVTIAGTVTFENGQKVIKMTNDSGHYKPQKPALLLGMTDLLNELAYRGTDIMSIRFKEVALP